MRRTASASSDTTITTNNKIYLAAQGGSRGISLAISRLPFAANISSVEMTLAGYRTFRWFMFHLYRINNGMSELNCREIIPIRDGEALKVMMHFLYADIVAMTSTLQKSLGVAPVLDLSTQLEETASALYHPPINIRISRSAMPSDHFFYMNVLHKIRYLIQPVLTASFNADLDGLKKHLESVSPKARESLLLEKGTIAIEHLQTRYPNITRTGTPLQMALYAGDEDIVTYLKTIMAPAEYERQSKGVFRNALPFEIRAELDAKDAPAVEYHNVMSIVQKAEAEKLCNEAFQFRVVDGKDQFTINTATVTDFQQKLENYVRSNPTHNSFILHRLFEIYEKLPGNYAEDCLFSQKAMGLMYALSSARWLHHYAQGIYYLGGGDDGKTFELPRRSFICRDFNSRVDIRSLVPARLGVDSYMSILGRCLGAGVPGPWGAARLEIFVKQKQQTFRTCYAEVASASSQTGMRSIVASC